MRSRPNARGALAITVALLAGACGSTEGPPATPQSAVAPTIKTTYLNQVHTDVLTDSSGYTLYVFQPDHRQRATCKGSCAAIWPRFLSPQINTQ